MYLGFLQGEACDKERGGDGGDGANKVIRYKTNEIWIVLKIIKYMTNEIWNVLKIYDKWNMNCVKNFLQDVRTCV